MVDNRRHGQMNIGRQALKLPDYLSHHDPLHVISQYDSAVITAAKLDERTHNSLQNLDGDSPYYHIAQDIFDALRSVDGHDPSASNPFITKDWINDVGVKAAYGWVNIDGKIYLDDGIAFNGAYYGEADFTNAQIIVSSSRLYTLHTNQVSCLLEKAWLPGYTGTRFTVIYIGNDKNTRWGNPVYWLAAGD